VTDPSFVAVGDVLLDVNASGAGHAASIAVSAGGSALNAALSAAACGADATVVGRVGNDLAGTVVRLALKERDVHANLAVDAEAPTGTFLVVDGEIRVDRGANARFEPDDLPERLEADAIVVSGYLPAATVSAALDRAGGEWVGLAPGRLDHIPGSPDAILVDEVEARRLTGHEPADAARALGGRCRLACVTRGAHGVVAVLDGRLETCTPARVRRGDAIGAGDAFAAALLVQLVKGAGLREALQAAAELGAAVAAGTRP
jgi:ribokinase